MATYNQSQMTLPSGDVVKFIDNTSGYTKNTGTITGVTAGTGLSGGGTSGAVTLNHSNSVTAQTTQAVYPIKIDAQGHISAYGSAVTIPSAVTESTVSDWGFTKNAGTVTSVRVQATSPVSSSVSTAQSGSLNTTISLSDGYGDTKNPYGVKDANVVLAGPSTGDDAAPTFRALVADDIPSITKSKISDFPTSMTPTSHAHGNITNAGDITTTSTIASGDRLIINDESASKVTNSSITFGTSTSTYLRNDGTWGTPSGTATGTITGVTAGTGLSGGGTSGSVTLNHSNSVTAQTTQAVYPIKIDAQGHISAYGSAVTIPAAVAVKGNAESSYRTGNVNLTPANIGAATSDHTHTTSLATSTGTSTITLAHGSKYQLTAGGTSVIFTMPSSGNTDHRRAYYGTCATAAATAAKEVTLSNTDGWELVAGTIVGVKFSYSNTAGSTSAPVTLNVNSTGAKQIYYNNAAYTGTSNTVCGYANRVTYYMYDGSTYWVWMNMGVLDGNSDTKVRQTLDTSDTNRPLLLAYSNNTVTTANVDNVSYRNNSIYANPSTGLLTTTGISTTTINGVTVGSSPKFTDTTYTSQAAASGGTAVSLVTTGEKYTWNNKSNLAIGTTATTAAAGNHTHTLSMATSTGTSSIELAANTKYQLTAGGSTYIFTTPPDANTTYSSKTAASGGTDVSLVTTGEKYTWNSKTSNTGTVTSITVKTTSPISGGSSTAVTSSGTWTISHANSGVTAGTYGSTTTVPKITVDATGHITGVTNTTITASADTKYTTCTLPVFTAAGSKAVTVSGVTANSNPVLDVYIDTAANVADYTEAWSHIYRADTSANTITFYSDAATSTALTVMVKDY